MRKKVLGVATDEDEKAVLEKDWFEEQDRLRIRFAEARNLVVKIESRETLASTNESLTEDEIMTRAKQCEDERRQVKQKRKEEIERAAQEEFEIKNKFLTLFEDSLKEDKRRSALEERFMNALISRFESQ